MQYPTLAQLSKMDTATRVVRLRGIDETTRTKLVMQCVDILAALSNEGLRKFDS
ncbi:hypothetical protein SEA_SCHIMMELS22_30 [Microbacterium phage Schimmels22]|nr:hypothetical protein SEA_SCHIMMELS22_30 [Microbacterium phage Schimmels22]